MLLAMVLANELEISIMMLSRDLRLRRFLGLFGEP